MNEENKTGKIKEGEQRSSAPSITLPKGGGAIQGIGEKFQVNPVTGTGSLSIPIATSPGRSGFTPQLSLSYDSGMGNSTFGLGWNIGSPSITRKTQKGLPRYEDSRESDIFLLSGAEDLVPVTNDPLPKETPDFSIRRYRPRIEGLFARIERWTSKQDGSIFWRTVNKENITTLFGQSHKARIADPEDSNKVFEWLIEKTFDDKGNIIFYEYKPEYGANLRPEFQLCEKNRNHYAQKYLKRILYGNTLPYLYWKDNFEEVQWENENKWLFELIFDYGEHIQGKTIGKEEIPSYHPQQGWPCRLDPFSSFRPGFELRTYRLCQRILMFHNFAELGPQPCLVKSTELKHDKNPVATRVLSIRHFGYRKSGNTYEKASMPPVSFRYSEAKMDPTIRKIDPESVVNMPQGIDSNHSRWVDLYGEGLSGILSETESAWYYKRNQGNGHFGPLKMVAEHPSIANLSGGQQQLVDLGGDGMTDLVVASDELNGYYEINVKEEWEDFQTFRDYPKIDWNDPYLRHIDLTGDGHPDILISEQNCFLWYPSIAKEGYDPALRVAKALEEEEGPKIVFHDAAQTIYLADMTGDGLTDVVRILNGSVCYWANLGYGRFSSQIIMGKAPLFDSPDLFNPQRIRLADFDGTGTTDLVYLGIDVIRFWANQSGNSWQLAYELKHFPKTDNLTTVSVMDLLGAGIACFVWSSPRPEDAGAPLAYINLMGQKPYLLMEQSNNMGAITRLQYTPSTTFYLEDRKARKPWITKLPFPVHVLERVETLDAVSGNRFVSRYAYHHGYFDGVEREFRGFGMVEQWDTEDYDTFQKNTSFNGPASNWNETTDEPPVYTKSWFHTGFYRRRDAISKQYENEYYQGDPLAWLLKDTVLPKGLTPEEEREACRALKGQLLRQEVYALDNKIGKSEHPYAVTESNYAIRLLQHEGTNRYAVFLSYPSETLSYHYERNPDDPRIAHQLTLEVDDFGNITKSAQLVYPRRNFANPEQARMWVTYAESDFINQPNETNYCRLGLPMEARTYELTGIPFQDQPLTKNQLLQQLAQVADIAYEIEPDLNQVQKRLIERNRQTYYDEDLNQELPLGQVAFHALPHTSYIMAFTQGLIDKTFNSGGANRVTQHLLQDEGKYVWRDGVWWDPSEISHIDADHFFLPQKVNDPFGHEIRVEYDRYWLMQEKVIDIYDSDPAHFVANTVAAKNDYRLLQPYELTNPNGNRTVVAFDTLGMVITTAIMGKTGANEGDELAGFARYQSDEQIDHLQQILNNPLGSLGKATTYFYYDLYAWWRNQELPNPKPNVANYVLGLSREIHYHDPVGAQSPVQIAMTYSDGFGREILSKVQAEDGPAPNYYVHGKLVLDNLGKPSMQPTIDRWVGNGRTIYNNKGKPVKQYEPFFDSNPYFTQEEALVQFGVTPILYYDPLERVIKTKFPDTTLSRVDFDTWQQTTFDQNDTVLDSDWHKDRGSPDSKGAAPDQPEQRAAWLASQHANTPQIQHLDTLGRPFLTMDQLIDDQGNKIGFTTKIEMDIEGNQLSITDAKNRVISRSVFNVLGEVIYTHSTDAGDRWVLDNVDGNEIHRWDSRQQHIETKYDIFQRPTHVYASNQAGNRFLAERSIYSESLDQNLSIQHNLKGQLYLQFDGGGKDKVHALDFKGNLLHTSKTPTQDYDLEADWTNIDALTDEANIHAAVGNLLGNDTFHSHTDYDALNRPVEMIAPDGSKVTYKYNKANLLEAVTSNLLGNNQADFVNNIDYNARGQRTRIQYANGVTSRYTYDPATFRLSQLLSTRNKGQETLQDLRYTYDPVGNITEITDYAQPTRVFDNQNVTPVSKYSYDALYRLREARGREHRSLGGQRNHPDAPIRVQNHPNDTKAVRNYSQSYRYDEVGNIDRMQHLAKNGGWTRDYRYEQAPNNRLTSTSTSDPNKPWGNYTYDAHGNMTAMPHLPDMRWNFSDELIHTSVLPEGEDPPEKQVMQTWFSYDSSGQRVRKLVVYANGVVKERLYINGMYEVFRRYPSVLDYENRQIRKERHTLHVMDDEQRIVLVETQTKENGQVIAAEQLDNIIRYQLSNHLGSASLELDKKAKVITYEEYNPYGTTAMRSGLSEQEVKRKRYRYTGMERDEATGLNYHGARYYATWLGRWVNCDPEFIELGSMKTQNSNEINLFRANSNNPILLQDLDGRKPKKGRLELFRRAQKNDLVRAILIVWRVFVIEGQNVDATFAEKVRSVFEVIKGEVKPGQGSEKAIEKLKENGKN